MDTSKMLFQKIVNGVSIKYFSLLLLVIIFSAEITHSAKSQSQLNSIRMAESIMSRHPNGYGEWDYVTGTVLRAFEELWRRTGDNRYFEYIKKTVDSVINSDGTIKNYKLSDYNLDEIKEGCLLLFLYQETGEEKYRKAALLLRSQLATHPRTSEGGFWHKLRYPHQMWLDGLYMGSPFFAEYGELFNEPEDFDDVVKQLKLMENHARDPITGLLYHGWDESRTQEWADSLTGCSPSFWGRAIGWYAMALVDVLDHLPLEHPGRDSVIHILQRLTAAVSSFQDDSTGVWWQVVDQGGREGNYLESSVSCMLTYSIAKGIRRGYVDESYWSVVEKGYQGIIQEFVSENADGTINLDRTCITAGLGYGRSGTYEYYVYETGIRSNDGKGLGPFITASIEMELRRGPSELQAFTISGNQINLQWNDNADDEDGFKIERTSDGDFIEIAIVDSNMISYQDNGLFPLMTYRYRIRAYRGNESSFYSNIASATTLAENGAPAYATQPIPFDGAASVSLTPVMSWTPGAAATSHDVYFGKINPPPFLNNQTDNSYQPGTLSANTIFFWRIDEKNNSGTTVGHLWSFTTREATIQPGLVAHWKLDEQAGSMMYDTSVNGNNGTLINMNDDAWCDGVLGNALQFDGIDDYVRAPHNPSIDFGLQDFSISFWLKQSITDRHMRYIIKGTHSSPGTGKRYEVFHHSSNVVRFSIDDDFTKSRVEVPNTNFVTGDWVHVVAVRNKTLDQLLLYANANLVGSASDVTGDISQNEDLFLGISPDEENTNLTGFLDDIRIYNYALNETDIEEIYQNAKSGIEHNRSPNIFNFDLCNYPNPFNARTRIIYSLPQKTQVTLSVYNLLGQEVKRLIDEEQFAGQYLINFDATNLNSGIYISRLDTVSGILTKKMIYLK